MNSAAENLLRAREALEEIIDDGGIAPWEYVNAVTRIQGGLEALEQAVAESSTITAHMYNVCATWLADANGYINAYSPDGFEVPYE